MIGLRSLLIWLACGLLCCDGWTASKTVVQGQKRAFRSQLWSEATVNSEVASTSEGEDEDENENEGENEEEGDWEYVEYERLTEADMVGSEWLVGTNWNDKPNKIDETWVRLVTNEEGKNEAYWGDDSTGVWSLDAASQYFSISKNYLWGKTIWAGIVEDYYYQQGAVRGWNYWSPAAVYGQWQARRLGIDPAEAGVAPWFKDDENDMESTTEDPAESEISS